MAFGVSFVPSVNTRGVSQSEVYASDQDAAVIEAKAAKLSLWENIED